MEEIKKILQAENLSFDDTDSSDSDSTYISGTRIEEDINATIKQIGKVNRLPTRIPDPKVYNRNALLARENRRKKKVHLENLEKDLEESRRTNHTLIKALKKQLKITRRLEQEKRYFQSIVANRTEILSLVTAINSRLSPQSSGALIGIDRSNSPKSSIGSTHLSSGSGSCSYDPDALNINFENSENDLESTPTVNATWDDIWETDFRKTFEDDTIDKAEHNIVNEHSYVSLGDNTTIDNGDAGVCLHISQGKVSFEFCPSCHWNATRAPPTQLLENSSV